MTEHDDKVAPTLKRAELIDSLKPTLSPEARVRVQGELSRVNARIKAINTISDGQLWISTWPWDTAAQNRGKDVCWQMQLELKLEHAAVVTLGRVYFDGMRDHVQSLEGKTEPRIGQS